MLMGIISRSAGEEGGDLLEDLFHGHRLGEGAVGNRALEGAAVLEVTADASA